MQEDFAGEFRSSRGNKFDMDRFKEVVGLSRDCTKLWKKVLETNMSRPAPISFFDETIHMGPAVVLRGSETAIEYYKALLAELEEKVMNWLRDMIGLPDFFEGVIQDTASTATLVSLLTAREKYTSCRINEIGFQANTHFRIYCNWEKYK